VTIAVGLLIGLVLGLTGAGGSLFAVPLLALLLHMPLQQATGVALGAVAASAFFGVLQRDRSDIAWTPALVILVGGSLSAPLGRWLSAYFDELWLLAAFSLLLLWVAFSMWRQALASPDKAQVLRAGSGHSESVHPQAYCEKVDGQWRLGAPCVAVAGLGGIGAGVLSGLLGVGGGFVIVPLLTLVAGLTMQQAVASSLLVISLVSGSGFLSYCWFSGGLDYLVLLQVSIGGVVGMLLGGRFAERLAGPHLQQGFAGMLLLTLAAMWLAALG